MSRKTPQQKKASSYKKDRRNCYGENSKASRKNIPKAKAHTRRAYRHKVNESLHEARRAAPSAELGQEEFNAISIRRKQWKKVPDEAIGTTHCQAKGTPQSTEEQESSLRCCQSVGLSYWSVLIAGTPNKAKAMDILFFIVLVGVALVSWGVVAMWSGNFG